MWYAQQIPWAAVADPHLDEAAARAIALEVARLTKDPGARAALIGRRLADELGLWAGLFCWSATEEGGGGPVQAWCCAAHTLPARASADEIAQQTLAALRDLLGWLRQLGATFRDLDLDTAGLSPDRAAERAAGALLPLVMTRTDSSDAWYNTYITTLRWWFEARGSGGPEIEAILARTLGGRFESWVGPEQPAQADAARAVGAALREPAAALEPQDGLAAWERSRTELGRAPPARLEREVRAGRDGHLDWITRVEAARDAGRAARMTEAARWLRAEVERRPLDGGLLRAAAGQALGAPTGLRETDAWAKGGRERYPWRPDLAAQLDDWLAEAADPKLNPAFRAARLYLDVAFLHPFPDGNARAARLALDATLWREGLVLQGVGPLFSLWRAPEDMRGAWRFADAVVQGVERREARPS